MLKDERMTICKKCPLYAESIFGPICNQHKYLGPNDEVSYIRKDGFIKGCNCILEKKTKNEKEHCPANKW